MNKKLTKYTPFKGRYKMPIDLFCERYGLDKTLVSRRLNALFWPEFDALVVPMATRDTQPYKIRRCIILKEQGCSDEFIARRLNLEPEMVTVIENLSDEYKEIFLSMKNYFYLNQDIDISKIFVEQKEADLV